MKKLLTVLLIVLISSFAFAEKSFWGIPFGKTEKEIKQIEREAETKIQNELKAFGGEDVSVYYGLDKDNKIKSIRFIFFSSNTNYANRIKSILDFYLIEKLGCKYVNGSYYNDDFIFALTVGENSLLFNVSDRQAVESALNQL